MPTYESSDDMRNLAASDASDILASDTTGYLEDDEDNSADGGRSFADVVFDNSVFEDF